MKEHQLEHIHKRFYVFSHVNGESFFYLSNDGGWTDDFKSAKLFPIENVAIAKAQAAKSEHNKWYDELYEEPKHPTQFVVGSVEVRIDGFYPMKVA